MMKNQDKNSNDSKLKKQRVITNFNLKDFEKAFVKPQTEESSEKSPESGQAKLTAKVLFELAADDSKATRRFFHNEIVYGEGKSSGSDAGSENGSRSPSARKCDSAEFHRFYEEAIKGRIKRMQEKSEAEEEAMYPKEIAMSGGDIVQEDSLLVNEAAPEEDLEMEPTPPKRLPRRREGAQNLGLLPLTAEYS